MKLARRNLVIGVTGVALAQAAAYLLYRRIERDRADDLAAAFDYDPVDPLPLGLDARLSARDGRERRLKEFLGAPLLVHFWATWCAPCRTELPQLLNLASPRTLLISVDETWPVVEHFLERDVPAQVLLDVAGEARRVFAIDTLPDTYLLDAHGIPLARFHGARAWKSDGAARTLERLIMR